MPQVRYFRPLGRRRSMQIQRKGSVSKGTSTPAATGGSTAPAAESAVVNPQAYLATVEEDSDCEVVYSPKPFQPEVQITSASAASSEGPRKCRGGCKEFSKSSSNAYIDMRTCKQCGTVNKTRKEPERSGSSRKTSRVKCKRCVMLLDEQPQSERKAREEAATVLRESSMLDFDLLRSIVGSTGDSLPVEVVVPAIAQFQETVEGHFATEPVLTRGDRLAYLQESLDDHVAPAASSWEVASVRSTSRTSRRGLVAFTQGVTDIHPALIELPVVNIHAESHVCAVLDEGCNSTIHGSDWIANAASKLAEFGHSTRFKPEGRRTFKDLSGATETLGSRAIPFSILGIEGDTEFLGCLIHMKNQRVSPTAALIVRAGSTWDSQGSEE